MEQRHKPTTDSRSPEILSLETPHEQESSGHGDREAADAAPGEATVYEKAPAGGAEKELSEEVPETLSGTTPEAVPAHDESLTEPVLTQSRVDLLEEAAAGVGTGGPRFDDPEEYVHCPECGEPVSPSRLGISVCSSCSHSWTNIEHDLENSSEPG